MGAKLGECAVATLLTVSLVVPVTAASLESADFDRCRLQKECRRLSLAELDRLRGGMSLMTSIGTIEITFGITQAVYINNKLVALTQLLGPGPGPALATFAPTPAQAQAISAAMQGAPVIPLSTNRTTASSSTVNPPSAAQRPATPAAIAPVAGVLPAPAPLSQTPTPAGQSQGLNNTGLNSTLNSVPSNTASAAQSIAPSKATASASAASPPALVAPPVTVNGSAVIPGTPVINVPNAENLRVMIVQNGAGNVVVPTAADIRSGVGTIIQNTANDQTIRAVTQMNLSIGGLNQAVSASSIQNAVRQGMALGRP